MACGCVPVVTAVGSLPEVAGGVGFAVEHGDVEAAGLAIRRALCSRDGARAAQRVASHFPISRRERDLKSTLDTLLPVGQ
jgi:glycosyltransferase involved in cell wall biosynthesis